ncbi:hypothetical protein AAG570_004049 [Ranatra chinensis]|uniref:Peptidase S8/S53 domain-containing protein n=1 Tax=Ranatra chinensis TaxID=642074 RepID=A0ABD0YPF8_9HEMI
MASKRRNMFQKNKTQETTENEHVSALQTAGDHSGCEDGALAPRNVFYQNKKQETTEMDPPVHWVEQQQEKRRVKRDGFGDFPSGFPSGFGDFGTFLNKPQYRSASSGFPDPLFKEEWYLNGGAKDGYDMNVAPAWARGYTGKGVVVSILDDGIQTNHPDLAANYVTYPRFKEQKRIYNDMNSMLREATHRWHSLMGSTERMGTTPRGDHEANVFYVGVTG